MKNNNKILAFDPSCSQEELKLMLQLAIDMDWSINDLKEELESYDNVVYALLAMYDVIY